MKKIKINKQWSNCLKLRTPTIWVTRIWTTFHINYNCKSPLHVYNRRMKCLLFLSCKMAQVQSDWIKSICENQCSNPTKSCSFKFRSRRPTLSSKPFHYSADSILTVIVLLVNLSPSLKSLAASNWFFCSTALYDPSSNSMTLPPCFTVNIMY